MEKPPSPRRYLPGLFLLLLAVGLTIRISNEPVRPAKSAASSELRKTGVTRPFKSRERSAPTFTFPQLRAPITVTSADELPITPEEARIELTDIANFESASSRGKSTATIIRRLCRSGHPDEAFASIEQSTLIGREAGITAFFLAANLDDAAIFAKIRDLPHPEDAVIAFAAYLRRVPIEQLRSLLAESGDLSDAFAKSFDAVLDLRLKSPAQRLKAEALIEELHRDGLASDNLLGQKILGDPSADPFEKWEQLRTRLSNSPKLLGASWNHCLNQMISADPSRTADYVASTTGNSPNHSLQKVLILWSANDPEAALRWYENRRETASDSLKDDAAVAFTVRARQDGRQEDALAWMEKIRNPEIRKFMSPVIGPPVMIRDDEE